MVGNELWRSFIGVVSPSLKKKRRADRCPVLHLTFTGESQLFLDSFVGIIIRAT